jgi:hypothetical protein
MSNKIIAEIRKNRFPDLIIPPDTYVCWRNLDPQPHTVETDANHPFFFNVGPLFPGAESSPVYFGQELTVDYVCRYHADMAGRVTVARTATIPPGNVAAPAEHGHDHGHDHSGHFQHFHGFVTGGRSPQRLFMSHTPVIADDRHCYQVILQGSFAEARHADAYSAIRNGEYGDAVMQTFHDGLALPDIGSGQVKLLPNASLAIYPGGKAADAPGLEQNIPIKIDRVLHFHAFQPDVPYPDGLAYLIYGDGNDVFIDHHITRAPSFHSVAKLKAPPSFWRSELHGTATPIRIPTKRIVDVSPIALPRAAFVDNAFHLFWLPPSGVISPTPQDPLIRRDASPLVYDVALSDGGAGQIEIGRFLHFDIRLLNNRVVIT